MFTRKKNKLLKNYKPYVDLSFYEVDEKANKLADLIEYHYNELINILLKYETYEVAVDETSRTLDLLRHINENKEYFCLRTGAVTSFLPKNQPLYAFTCFVVVPSLMASEVHFRIPHTAKHFFSEVLELLGIDNLFPNIRVSNRERLEFLKERSAVLENPKTGESRPVTDIVIFTGTLANAEKLRLVFDKRTLFISNGAGHNPVVISKDANLNDAVDAVITLQFYNQGQDCAAPSAILVHKSISKPFMKILRDKVKDTKVGNYENRSCRIGPISDPTDLLRIQGFLLEHLEFIDSSTPGTISTKNSTIAPTIIFKPLSLGGNFEETFAPVIFVQEYARDQELKNYFENRRYAPNAMYVTLYGTSNYIENLIGKTIDGKILHDESTLIYNTHLHAPGVERGTKPYGGYGVGASSISINGKLIAMPTLPQRDIYEWFVRPLLRKKSLQKIDLSKYTQVTHKNVSKLLRIKLVDQTNINQSYSHKDEIYIDTQHIKDSGSRFVKISEKGLYPILTEPNIDYIAMLEIGEIRLIQELLSLLQTKTSISFEEFKSGLYAIPKEEKASNKQNASLQRRFFQNIYQLLFARNEGPRLAEFLWNLEEGKVNKLLDIVGFHK